MARRCGVTVARFSLGFKGTYVPLVVVSATSALGLAMTRAEASSCFNLKSIWMNAVESTFNMAYDS